MPTIDSLIKLFEHELKDIYDAQKHQVLRLEQVFEMRSKRHRQRLLAGVNNEQV